MNHKLLLGVLLLFAFNATSQKNDLKPVIVKGFSDKDSIHKTPTSASVIEIRAIQHQASGSLNFPLNQIAGVSFEERGYGGSRRISIRGSALRSPFGVRNIKCYWNGMPVTSPDGSSPIEIFSPNIINRIHVLKGTTGSFYGAGTGGTLLFESDIYNTSQAIITLEHGSYGLMGLQSNVHVVEEKNQFNVRLNYTQNNGYRDQEGNKGKHALLQWNHQLNKNHKLFLLGFLYEGSWGLPGAIDSITALSSPTTASDFAIVNNTRVDRLRTQVGIGHEWNRANINWKTILYGNLSNKVNPYGTSAFYNGFKDEKQKGFGGRTTASKMFIVNPSIRIKSSIGAEFQQESNNFQEFDIVDGDKGGQRNHFDIQSQNTLGFLQLSGIHVNGTRLSIGGSLNQINYQFNDLLANATINQSGNSHFDLLDSYKATLSQQLKKNLLFVNYSNGYSAPSVWEMTNEDGTYNTRLQPEQVTTLEAGWKNHSAKNLYVQLVGYHSWLENGIVATPLPSGYTEFTNGGIAQLQGVELESAAKLYFSDKLYTELKTGYQFQHYTFTEYIQDGVDLSNKVFPGVPQHRVTNSISFKIDQTYRIGIRHQFVDERFLNDLNTLSHPSYHLFNVFANALYVGDKLVMLARVGVNNVLDQQYSSFIQYNAFGGRYYNPSPGRNYYIRLTFAI